MTAWDPTRLKTPPRNLSRFDNDLPVIPSPNKQSPATWCALCILLFACFGFLRVKSENCSPVRYSLRRRRRPPGNSPSSKRQTATGQNHEPSSNTSELRGGAASESTRFVELSSLKLTRHQLIQALYSPNPPETVAAIQEVLQRLQKSEQGWQLAQSLISHPDNNIKFFAALTLIVKLNKER